tara:strand:- start:599 stop:1525 length:927 start_codon:yes stop_codon:yes gene_type:complete
MGLGGALVWTAVFKNIKKQHPNKKIIYIYDVPFKNFLKGKRHPDFSIYENNKDLTFKVPNFLYKRFKFFFDSKLFFKIKTQNSSLPFTDDINKDKISYKNGKHMVDYICKDLDINVTSYNPKILLSKQEVLNANTAVNNLIEQHSKFICIEPNFKPSFTVNKAWFWDRWQELVDKTNHYIKENDLDIKILQVGAPKSKTLKGVIDFTNQGLSFRETAGVLAKSEFFIGYMGGLIHLNKAVEGKSIVLISGFEPLELATYSDDINIYKRQDCSNCGLLLKPCPIERKCMQDISVDEVYDEIIKKLKDIK